MDKFIETNQSSEFIVASKWKYLAKDKDDKWFFYTEEPYLSSTKWMPLSDDADTEELHIVNINFAGDWKESLHRVKDGKLFLLKRLWVPKKDEPVMIKISDTQWYPRYSTGKLNSHNGIVCYPHGTTSWTCQSDDRWVYSEWRRPTKEELEQVS